MQALTSDLVRISYDDPMFELPDEMGSAIEDFVAAA
jgi:hypothetical protein